MGFSVVVLAPRWPRCWLCSAASSHAWLDSRLGSVRMWQTQSWAQGWSLNRLTTKSSVSFCNLLTLVNFYEKIKINLYFISFFEIETSQIVEIHTQGYDWITRIPTLQAGSKYHGHWWPCDAWSQGISSHNIDPSNFASASEGLKWFCVQD